MKTTDTQRKEKDLTVSGIVRSLDDIVQRLADVDHKMDHLIFIHRYDRYAYAQAGQYNSDSGMYEEE